MSKEEIFTHWGVVEVSPTRSITRALRQARNHWVDQMGRRYKKSTGESADGSILKLNEIEELEVSIGREKSTES